MACLETTAEQRLIPVATIWYECSMSKHLWAATHRQSPSVSRAHGGARCRLAER